MEEFWSKIRILREKLLRKCLQVVKQLSRLPNLQTCVIDNESYCLFYINNLFSLNNSSKIKFVLQLRPNFLINSIKLKKIFR